MDDQQVHEGKGRPGSRAVKAAVMGVAAVATGCTTIDLGADRPGFARASIMVDLPADVARKVQTVVGGVAATYNVDVYNDSGSNSHTATKVGSSTGTAVGSAVTIDLLPASRVLDFDITVLDGSSNTVGRGLAQATLTSQTAVNNVGPIAIFANGGTGAFAGNLTLGGGATAINGSVTVTGTTAVVSARFKLTTLQALRVSQVKNGSCGNATFKGDVEGPAGLNAVLPGQRDSTGAFLTRSLDGLTTFTGSGAGFGTQTGGFTVTPLGQAPISAAQDSWFDVQATFGSCGAGDMHGIYAELTSSGSITIN